MTCSRVFVMTMLALAGLVACKRPAVEARVAGKASGQNGTFRIAILNRTVLKAPSAYNSSNNTMRSAENLKKSQNSDFGSLYCVLPANSVVTLSKPIDGPYYANHIYLKNITSISIPKTAKSSPSQQYETGGESILDSTEEAPSQYTYTSPSQNDTAPSQNQNSSELEDINRRILEDVERIKARNEAKLSSNTQSNEPQALSLASAIFDLDFPMESELENLSACNLKSGYIYKLAANYDEALSSDGKMQLVQKFNQLPQDYRAQHYSDSCGRASVAIVINLLTGRRFKDSSLDSYLQANLNRYTGFTWRSPNHSPSQWPHIERSLARGLPVVIGLGGEFKSGPASVGHILVILGVEGETVFLGDPNGGYVRQTTKARIDAAQGHDDGKFLFIANM